MIIRAKQVQEITGLSRTSIWRLERAGEFPRSIQLTKRAIGWVRSEVEEFAREYAARHRRDIRTHPDPEPKSNQLPAA